MEDFSRSKANLTKNPKPKNHNHKKTTGILQPGRRTLPQKTKKTMNRAIIIAIAATLSLVCLSPVTAQRSRKQVKKVQIKEPEPTVEELTFESLLPSTAKIMFIDSIVVNQEDMAKHIALSSSCGNIEIAVKDSILNYSYTNEFGNKRYLSIADARGIHNLYVQDKLGRKWTEPEKVELDGDFTDIICPYVMPDGITLYFAARNGEDNIGKHDIFYTVYDSDSRSFYRPQSLGLPFNSYEEDCYYVIDEFSNLGYLTTTRGQQEGKACVYTFVPTESRETYNQDDIPENKIKQLAMIASIAETQTDKEALAQARRRYQTILADAFASNDSPERIHFVINGKTTYTSLSQFKSETNKKKYVDYSAKMNILKEKEQQLADMRLKYHGGNRTLADRIDILETETQQDRLALRKMEKQIRNAELMK